MSGPQRAQNMVRRLGETSDLAWMDDSTDEEGLLRRRRDQALRLVLGPEAKQKSSQGWGGGDWEETGTWGRSSPGLPGLISLRLSLYGHRP